MRERTRHSTSLGRWTRRGKSRFNLRGCHNHAERARIFLSSMVGYGFASVRHVYLHFRTQPRTLFTLDVPGLKYRQRKDVSCQLRRPELPRRPRRAVSSLVGHAHGGHLWGQCPHVTHRQDPRPAGAAPTAAIAHETCASDGADLQRPECTAECVCPVCDCCALAARLALGDETPTPHFLSFNLQPPIRN